MKTFYKNHHFAHPHKRIPGTPEIRHSLQFIQLSQELKMKFKKKKRVSSNSNNPFLYFSPSIYQIMHQIYFSQSPKNKDLGIQDSEEDFAKWERFPLTLTHFVAIARLSQPQLNHNHSSTSTSHNKSWVGH